MGEEELSITAKDALIALQMAEVAIESAKREESLEFKGIKGKLLQVGLEHVKKSAKIEGTVDFVEALGTDTIVHANIGNGQIIKVKLPGHIPLEVGSKVKIVIDLDNIHVFDKNTEKAII